MKSNIDSKDKQILEVLYKNGRALISKITTQTRIQRDSIKYRLENLKKKGVIKSISANLNYEKIGYPILYKLDVNIQNYNLEVEESFINYLCEYPNVLYIDNITGKFDLTVIIAAKNSSNFYDVLREIRSQYPEVMRDHEISTINKIIKFWDYTQLLKQEQISNNRSQ